MTRGDKRIALYPSDHFKVTYSIAFDHPLLRTSRARSGVRRRVRRRHRPGPHVHVPEGSRNAAAAGLALGGSLENAIVVGDTGVLNNALRFDDEFVRHKILDVIGDMALVGYPLIGHLVAHRGGHALHTAFAAQVLEESDAWTLVETAAQPERIGVPGGVVVKESI
jgi:UDP-3-O-[3-hydroxymyristoyl] N-acetylglucosamine deacetylase